MKVSTLLSFLLLGHSFLFAQGLSVETFGTVTTLPSGWSASISLASNTKLEVQTTSNSNVYLTPVAASGGSNLTFKNCGSPTSGITVITPTFDFTGKSNISIGFGQRRSSASFNQAALTLDYSLDGSTWLPISYTATTSSSWNFNQIDLLTAVDNQSTVSFRFSYTNTTTTGCSVSSPNFRIDDFAVGENSALPVRLVTFNVSNNSTTTLLSFSTATELNNSHFVIERSANARDFSEIGQVQGAGTTRVPQSYTFTDEKPLTGVNYYRLRQVDFDGVESFSPVVSVVFGKTGHISIAPSPATDRVRIQLEESYDNDGLWQVYDNTGRQVLSGAWEAESTDYELNVNTLPEGMYTFRLVVGTQVQVKQFRKM